MIFTHAGSSMSHAFHFSRGVKMNHLNATCTSESPSRRVCPSRRILSDGHVCSSSTREDPLSPNQPHPFRPPLEAAWSLLTDYTAKEARGLAQPLLSSAANRESLRDALLLAAASPWPPAGWEPGSVVLIGVVASDVRLAVRALRDYCSALNIEFILPKSRVPGVNALPQITTSVYVKLNSQSRLCYVSDYVGRDTGVLISLGTQQIGHLPLGLHDEAMARPPPSIVS